MPSNLLPEVPEEQLLTTKEVAKLLKRSPQFVLDRINAGEIGYCDLSAEGAERRSLRVPISAYRAYIEARTVSARLSA